MEHLLEGIKLSKVFSLDEEDIQAVVDVDFRLDDGEILGIVGESGSGKSTLIKMISGMVKPTSGVLRYEGEDITGSSLREMGKKLQVIFQDANSSFDPRKTMKFSILEAGRGKTDDKEIDRIITGVGLSDKLLSRKPDELSGGQCQRMAIARALYSGVNILLCDEMTSALDVSVQSKVIELLQEIKKQHNLSIIFVSHDIALISMICDRVMVMKDGRVVEEGETCDIIKHPKDEYTKLLIDAAKKQSIDRV